MSPLGQIVRRYSLALCGAAAIAGCSSGGTDNNKPGTIALGLSSSSGTVSQGGQVVVTGTLTRGGGFTGNVNLTVTGAPTGVTGTVSNTVTTGTTTTATVTISVAATTAPGQYQLVVHGTGSGVTEATANYQLTVTPPPAVALSLSAPTLTIVQGTAIPTTTVTLTRTNFTGDVTLAVDNLPTGVTAAFAPANPQSGNSSVLTLTVAADAPTGTTSLLVRATGTSITAATTPLSLTIAAPAPDYQLSLSNAALNIAQGASAPTTVTIARTNFTGPVTLTTTSTPASEGITVTFNPASPTSAGSTIATVAVGAGVTPGVYNMTVDGAGTPGNRSTPLVLTVVAGIPPGNFNLSTTPSTNVNATQGGAAVPVTVNINHTGGNISSVTLSITSATALPAGLTLGAFSLNPTGQPSSTFSITAAGSVPVGAYSIVIHGNVLNLTEQTVGLTINVVAPGGSGNVTYDMSACTGNGIPLWAAFQNGGLDTPWQVVTPVGGIYSFTIDAGQGGFTYVRQSGGSTGLFVAYMSQAEFTAGPIKICGGGFTPTGRDITGTLAGLNTGDIADVAFGGAGTFPNWLAPDFQLQSAALGAHDLVVYTHPQAITAATDRMGLWRDQDPGASFGTLNMATDPNVFMPLVRLVTISGGVTGETFSNSMSYFTGPSCDLGDLYDHIAVTGTSFNSYGAPTSVQRPGDRHQLAITGDNGHGVTRAVEESFHDLVAHTVAMPAMLPSTVPTESGVNYSILRTQFVAPPEYTGSLTFQQSQGIPARSVFMTATHNYFGSQTVDLRIGHYSGLAGWQDSWGPTRGTRSNTGLTLNGGNLTNVCSSANSRFSFMNISSTF